MKYILLALIVIFTGLIVSPANNTYAATNLYVATWGNNTWSGSFAAPFRTIDYAVDHCSAGDTIYVRAGTYNERVTFGISGSAGNIITLTNYGSETVIVDGTGLVYSWGGLVHMSNKDYITIDGLTIRNATTGSITQAGIFIGSRCDYITVNDCDISATNMSGIMTWGCRDSACSDASYECTNIIVTNNYLHDTNYLRSQEAISIWTVDGFEVAYNELYLCRKEGIDVKGGSDNGTVHHNYVHEIGGPGIYLDNGAKGDGTLENVDIYNNFIHDIGDFGEFEGERKAGISIECEDGGEVRNINIYNNIAGYNCNQGAIWLGNQPDATKRYIDIYNNTLHSGNDWGGSIYIETPGSTLTNLDVYNNIFCGTRDDNRMIRLSGGRNPGNFPTFNVDNNIYQNISTYYDNDWGGVAGTGNAPDDPEFAITPNTNVTSYKITAASPAKDTASATWSPAVDYWGTSRPQGVGYDIGAHELDSIIKLLRKICGTDLTSVQNFTGTSLANIHKFIGQVY